MSAAQPSDKELRIRIPGWCKAYRLTIQGKPVNALVEKGYAVVKDWKPGDVVSLEMEMPVEKVAADPRVKQDVGKRAVQRGPLVYCLEEVDNPESFDQLRLDAGTSFEVVDAPDLLGGVKLVHARSGEQQMTFIPYYAWDNRAAGRMKVWVDCQE